MSGTVLVIDQGTTSTRAIIFDAGAQILGLAQEEFPQIYPQPGEVEHDPDAIWRTVLSTGRAALAQAGLEAGAVAGLGIANQRETVVVWDRTDGRPIHNAIVWQDRRTADCCAALEADGNEALIAARTGLRIDPYFSATKIAWILDKVQGARQRAEQGQLAFGTIDSFLLWRLTDGKVHATDATNASRTLLFDIHRGAWNDDLLRLFRVPRAMLPEVRDNAADFGVVAAAHFGGPLVVRGMVGDQQGALIGQACLSPGMIKSTFGTGAFVLLNTGDKPIASTHKLVTTIAYQWGRTRHYALEGSIFSAGATVQWLRDGLGIVKTAAETGTLAAQADPAQSVYIVPAFVGLGAPHWDSAARGAIHGLTRGAGRRELARAALESTVYQTRDLVDAMRADAASALPDDEASVIRVDGGMSASDWTMQFLADMLGAPVHRPHVLETTALGAGFLAGWQAGLFDDPGDFAAAWQLEKSYAPTMEEDRRASLYTGWRSAVKRTLS